MRMWIVAIGCGIALSLSACSGSQAPEAAADPAAGEAPAATAEAAAEAPGATQGDQVAAPATPPPATAPAGVIAKGGAVVPLVSFDPQSVPLSERALGELPFFTLPDGYAPVNRPNHRAYARFPVRLGEGVHWVEGPTWSARIGIARERRRDKQYASLELQRNLEAVLEQAGAALVFDGPLERDVYFGPELENEIGGGFIQIVNRAKDTPTRVYVIRQSERTVWVMLTLESSGAGMLVIDERPFVATARWSDTFPHLALPEGYRQVNRGVQRDFDMFPFWTGSAFEEVEGRTHAIRIGKERDEYSMHEVRRNLQAMMAEVGGTQVFSGRIPKDASDSVDASLRSHYSAGADHSWHGYDAEIWRVDLPDGRQVWVHARLEYLSAGWVVAERKGFVQTAALLPASALKQQLDADGRVAIQVNFAVDSAEILPDSQPQLEQVLALLREDGALALSVEGHTDNTGTAARNRTLSDARAQSVVAALVAKGIDPSRLSAEGHGQDRPVADNGTEQGRARNRRVELVRR